MIGPMALIDPTRVLLLGVLRPGLPSVGGE